ncbi:hypothetical protein ON010_g17374 [Phytophthora cinnamomi]|nr:hypothetical protein ON010_g17374 [Phytophthora cinnamomi]
MPFGMVGSTFGIIPPAVATKATAHGVTMQRMPIQELSDTFSLLMLDAVGPLVISPRGNKFILVFTNFFTRLFEAFAIPQETLRLSVETMVNEVVSIHGVPERLFTDQGSNFISELARSFYETLGFRKLFGAAYHLQTQGLAERFNGTLLGMLLLFVNETQTDWDLYRPCVLFAYRTSYHEALRDSPFFSLFGRDPVLPLDLAFFSTNNNWKRATRLQLIAAGCTYSSKHPSYDREAALEGPRQARPASRVTIKSQVRGVSTAPDVDDDGSLSDEDLPSAGFVERLIVSSEGNVFPAQPQISHLQFRHKQRTADGMKRKPPGRSRVTGTGRKEPKHTRDSFTKSEKLEIVRFFANNKVDATLDKYFPKLAGHAREQKRKLMYQWRKEHDQLEELCADPRQASLKYIRPTGSATILPTDAEMELVQWINALRKDGAPVSSKMRRDRRVVSA